MYGASSMSSSLSSTSLGSTTSSSASLPPFNKLIKVWNTSPNTRGLDKSQTVKSLQRQLNKIIRKTRANRHNWISNWSVYLEAYPSTAFDDICEDWDAAFASISLPLTKEIERLENECRTLTGEVRACEERSDAQPHHHF